MSPFYLHGWRIESVIRAHCYKMMWEQPPDAKGQNDKFATLIGSKIKTCVTCGPSTLWGNTNIPLRSMACHDSLGQVEMLFTLHMLVRSGTDCDHREPLRCMLTMSVSWVLCGSQGQGGYHSGSWINCSPEVFPSLQKQRIYTLKFDLGKVAFCPSGFDNVISKLWSAAPCPRWTFGKWPGKVR